jgi:hypothetical protein
MQACLTNRIFVLRAVTSAGCASRSPTRNFLLTARRVVLSLEFRARSGGAAWSPGSMDGQRHVQPHTADLPTPVSFRARRSLARQRIQQTYRCEPFQRQAAAGSPAFPRSEASSQRENGPPNLSQSHRQDYKVVEDSSRTYKKSEDW